MKEIKRILIMSHFLALVFLTYLATPCFSQQFSYSFKKFWDDKQPIDDPRPMLNTKNDWRNQYPPEIKKNFISDEKELRKTWKEVVGFRAPDIVGKIAPEIKPGTYKYRDKEKHPGFKELMWPDMYRRFNRAGPPHIGNFEEITIYPTRQYYWPLAVAKASLKYRGATKQDEKGYIIPGTWKGGVPFPRPSGPYKAVQIVYNFERSYINGENTWGWLRNLGFNKNLSLDWDSSLEAWALMMQGRTQIEPFGWYDKRAKKRKERKGAADLWISPRDIYGQTLSWIWYTDVEKDNLIVAYLNALRRVRRLSGGDTQDPITGLDLISDDYAGFAQKISPEIFPYTYKILAEREYLAPFITTTHDEYMSSKGYAFKNFKFERRPVYVVELTSLDKNYVYGKRVLYIDRETFVPLFVENYDRKGRLYRTLDQIYNWFPENGSLTQGIMFMRDHIDLHSSYAYMNPNPVAFWIKRKHFDVGYLSKQIK